MKDITEYQMLACRTESPDYPGVIKRLNCPDPTLRLLHAALGLAGEVGELAEPISVRCLSEAPMDRANLVEELGDLCWYAAIACDALACNFAREAAIQAALIIENVPDSGLYVPRDAIAAFCGLSQSVGEFVDAVKKHIYYGSPLGDEKMRTALGAVICHVLGLTVMFGSDIEDICRINIAKLQRRYEKGFSEAAATKRDLAAEREVLEGKVTAENE